MKRARFAKYVHDCIVNNPQTFPSVASETVYRERLAAFLRHVDAANKGGEYVEKRRV